MADNAPNFDAMTPEEIMAWMETLAKRQGADTQTLTTAADQDIPEVDPDSVVIDEPGYIPSEGKDRGKKIGFGVPIAKPATPAPAAKPTAPAAKPVIATPPPPPAAKPVAPAPAAKTPSPAPAAQPAAAQLPIFDEPEGAIPAPDWLANLGIDNELPLEQPVQTAPEPAAATPSLSWLESLAVDSSNALPDFDLSSLGKELTPAVAQTPSADTNPVNWLESLAQNQADVLPEAPVASNPVNWLESLAQEQGVQDSPASASTGDDPVNWLESLAKRQGARSEELTTEADLNLPPLDTPSAAATPGYSSYTFDSPVPPAKSEPPKQPSPFAAGAPADPAAWLDSLASQAFESTKPQAIPPPPPPAQAMSDSDIQQALKKGELVPHDQMEAWMQRQLKEGASRPEPEELSGDYDPDAPPVKADLPDWLIEQVGDAIPLDESTSPAASVAQTPALMDTILEPPNVTDIPDWLKEDEPDSDDLDSIFATPVPENWAATSGFIPATPPSDTLISEPKVAASSLIDPNDPWVEALEMEYRQAHGEPKDLVNQLPPSPTATPLISTTTTLQSASLPPENDVPVGQPDTVPDWLAGITDEQAPQVATTPTEESTPAMPDWLTMEITEPQTAASDVPDWLADVDVEPADIPDWLKQTITSTTEDIVITPSAVPLPAAITPFAPPSTPAIVPVRASPAPVPVAAQNIDVAATLQNARAHATSNNLDASLPHYEMLIRANASLDAVVDDLGKLADKFKTSPAVHRVLGDTLMRQGKLQAALDTYRKALNQL